MNIITKFFRKLRGYHQVVNHKLVKLGKLQPKCDNRTLKLSKYLTHVLPQPKPEVDYSNKISVWGMMKNDEIGDCAIVAPGHMMMCWTSQSEDKIFIPTDEQIVESYSAITGYKPGDSSTDNGSVEIDVLNYWRNKGIAGRKIVAYVSVNTRNLDHVKLATDLFGGLYTGFALPLSAQNQKIWDVTSFWNTKGSAGSWGGHAVNIVAYDKNGLTCVTWGAKQKMTWAFWKRYCDEAYAIISNDWLTDVSNDTLSPQGIDIKNLKEDLDSISK